MSVKNKVKLSEINERASEREGVRAREREREREKRERERQGENCAFIWILSVSIVQKVLVFVVIWPAEIQL